MNIDELNQQYEQFKEEYTYQYLKYVGEKCKDMMQYSKDNHIKTIDNEFFLNFIIISAEVSGMGRQLGINFSFSFEDEAREIYDFNFTSNDTFEHTIHDDLI